MLKLHLHVFASVASREQFNPVLGSIFHHLSGMLIDTDKPAFSCDSNVNHRLVDVAMSSSGLRGVCHGVYLDNLLRIATLSTLWYEIEATSSLLQSDLS